MPDLWISGDLSMETIFKAILPVDCNGWGGVCEIQKHGRKYHIQYGDKIGIEGKNRTYFLYQSMVMNMKINDIVPVMDKGSDYGFLHPPIWSKERHEKLRSCESAYNSDVIQYSIKETEWTEKYDQKHGIKTRYQEPVFT
jgi:hypothetical protein